jgi:hypothetical protein
MRKYLLHVLIISFVFLCNFGCVSTPYGSKYVGESKDGKIHGQGTLTLPDGSKYVGEWRDGTYVVELKDDKMHGQGTLTFLDGNKYVGERRDGKKHGQGTKTLPDGTKYVGEWRDGSYVGESKDYRYSDSEDTYSNREKYKELDERKYPGINEKQRRMERAINKGDKEALYKELFPGDLPFEYYGY